MRSEEDDLLGQDNTANVLDGANVGYDLTGGTGVDGTNWNLPAAIEGLSSTAATIVDGVASLAAGDAVQNRFVIRWRLGTQEGNMAGTSLLAQSNPADRYVTNVFLELSSK